MIFDGEKLQDGSILESDICIIGCGAAGLSIASEFKASSYSINIIESGKPYFDPIIQEINKVQVTDLPMGPRSRARQIGGSTTIWSGKWLPLMPSDFAQKKWLGVDKWPISFEDLRPYYSRASQLLKGPDISSYCGVRPEDTKFEESGFAPVSVYWLKADRLDFGTGIGAFIKRSQNISIFHSVTVTDIRQNSSKDEVICVEGQTLNSKQVTVKAKYYVLATGGVENARLLLASDRQSENGIANETGLVGKFFMDHPKGSVATVKLHDEKTFPLFTSMNERHQKGHRLDFGTRLSDELVEQEKLVNSYVVWRRISDIEPSLILRSLYSNVNLLVRGQIKFKTLSNIMKDVYRLEKWQSLRYVVQMLLGKIMPKGKSSNKFRLNFHVEQEPLQSNAVTLSETMDARGQSRAMVSSSLSARQHRSLNILHEEIRDYLQSTGSGEFFWDSQSFPEFGALLTSPASHHSGTTRMGTDRESSVVNADCRTHSLQNLYICGSSVFPSVGIANPTFTIVALALRLADKLKERLR